MNTAEIEELQKLAEVGGRRERTWALLNGVAVHSYIKGKLVREYPNGRRVIVENYLSTSEREVPCG